MPYEYFLRYYLLLLQLTSFVDTINVEVYVECWLTFVNNDNNKTGDIT